jgi:hypothetical protein
MALKGLHCRLINVQNLVFGIGDGTEHFELGIGHGLEKD